MFNHNIAIWTGTAERNILQLNDNHPKAIAQRKIQQAAMSSQQVKQSEALQKMANDSMQINS